MIIILDPELSRKKITFHNIRGPIDKEYIVRNLYYGLNWNGISYAHKSFLIEKYPKSGYVTSFIQGGSSFIAYFSENGAIGSTNNDEVFTFVSITACAAWNDNLQLIIKGYRNDTELNTETVTLVFGKPESFQLRWKGNSNIEFRSSGGTAHLDSGSANRHHVIITELEIDY